MTDDPLKKLEDAMSTPPEPRGKAVAAEAALRVFEDENSSPLQETAAEARPTSQTAKLRSWIMTTLSPTRLHPALMGGASFAALSLGLFIVFQANDAPPPAPKGPLKEAAEQLEVARSFAAQAQAPQERERVRAAMQKSGILQTEDRMEADLATLATPADQLSSEGAVVARAIRPPDFMAQSAAPVAAPEQSDRYANAAANPVKLVAEEPVSTFSIDVDTASMALVRQSLMSGVLPPKDAVRTEEMINYFPYAYPAPTGDAPFRATTTVMDAPWAEGRKLLHIGIRGALPKAPQRSNFTFLIDTSGSMQGERRLPLLIASLRLLLNDLGPDDSIAIVTYAGASRIVLEPTKVAKRDKIHRALDTLVAGGGTAGAAGIVEAYRLAEDSFDGAATNRVILATDGDFNIGASSPDALQEMIAKRRESGVYLSVLGFGRGNLNDALMQSLAQAGNGQAAYIDTLAEARKVLVEERATLHPIANDVKLQVEFNPAAVSDYRLIGYETRALAREDFNNDKVDAGEIGAGHRVTAIYEVTPVGGPARIDDLRYQPAATGGDASELAFLRLRYKRPGEAESQLIETPIANEISTPDADTRFAVAMAGFGQILRGSPHLGDWGLGAAIRLASDAKGDDRFGYRAEAIRLMRLAEAIDVK